MQKNNLNFFRSSVCELMKDQPLDTAGSRDAQVFAQFHSQHTDTFCQFAAANNKLYLEHW